MGSLISDIMYQLKTKFPKNRCNLCSIFAPKNWEKKSQICPLHVYKRDVQKEIKLGRKIGIKANEIFV